VGRAPITAAAYLVAYHAMNSMAALGYIRAVRPIIAPNGIQMRRLQEWETLLRNKK
jgi:protein-tyrosine phosphatase